MPALRRSEVRNPLRSPAVSAPQKCLHEGEFLRLLQTLVDGGAIDRECIKTIAAAVVLSVRRARGPKVTAPSAAHEQFLETNASFRLRAGYTRFGVLTIPNATGLAHEL